MGIKTDLNIAPYFDDYDIAKKFYRVLFKPGFAVQARELTQLQTTLQNQIEQFGENIYKEGSIIKGCTFNEIRNLKYIKVIDGIRPEDFIERTEVDPVDGTIDEFYYEIEDEFGLKALVVQGTSGFQSRAPDLNTFFVVYLNTAQANGFEKKQYEPNDTLEIREFILRTQEVNEETVETIIDNGIVATTSVASFSDPIGDSFGLNATEGAIFQRGHFLFVDDQTVIVKKYLSDETVEFELEPNNISVGYIVDENIITSQQDLSLLDNANGSPNENAPGADRLLLVPRLVARPTDQAEADAEFFILRRYQNGEPIETRDISQFNPIATELARRTYETHGDYTQKPFNFDIVEREETNDFFVEVGEGVAYSKGYRVSNDIKRFFRIPEVERTERIENQPVNFDYGGFVRIVDIDGNLPFTSTSSLQTVDLQDANTNVIGTAIVKNFTEDRLYLFGSRMDANTQFSEVKFVDGGAGTIEIEPKVINSSESRLVFDFNRSFVKDVDDFEFSIRKSTATVIDTNSEIIIAPEPDEEFDFNTFKDLLVINSVSREKINILNIDIVLGNLVLTMPVADENVVVYYNIKKTGVQTRVKQVLDVFVKTVYVNDISIYTLGLPDVIEIISITDFEENDVTDSFRLITNQKDNFYDHSYIEKLRGSPDPAEGQLVIKVKTFRIDSTTGVNLFTIDSYANVEPKDIPVFTAQNGDQFNLRTAADFRPYRAPIADYSATEGAATLLTVRSAELPDFETELFASNIEYLIPAVDTAGSATIEYYASRTDFVVASGYGRISYITGSDVNGSFGNPNATENTILAEIRIPGFPVLSADEGFRKNRINETISLSTKATKTYTMRDIDKISNKVDRLAYYVTLTELEKSASNLIIQDVFGNNRFKNGIIVDTFDNLLIADVSDPTFNASVDKSETTLRPSFKQFPLDLRVKNTNGTNEIGASTALATNRIVRFLNQPYATNFRSCTSNVFNYTGTGFITPEYDVAYDTVVTPRQVNIDLTQPFVDFAEAISEFVPLNSFSSNLANRNVNTTSRTTVNGNWRNQTITTITRDTFLDIARGVNIEGSLNEQLVGDFVTDFQFRPFIRSREVEIEMYGLRPNTRHFFFFDEQDVNTFVAPGVFAADLPVARTDIKVVKSGNFGTSVTTNANGELFAVFKIPENRFIVGERELIITDVDSFDDVGSAGASLGKLKYNAYNFSVDKIGLSLTTRDPEISVFESRTSRTVTNRNVQTRRTQIRVPSCPLAQTFFIKENMAQGAEALFVNRIDLYFKRKSPTNGVTIQIREVENGFPAWSIIPFAKKHLRSEDVVVSDDGTDATVVIFDTPIRLEAETEYAIVVQPDADDPDYLIFTTKAGGTDLATGEPINADWGDGVLFTSTNNRAWTPYQDEDIKFDLFRYNFNVNSGTVELETSDYEFIRTSGVAGNFINGELAYAFKGTSTFAVNLDTTTNVVTGSGLATYDQGDYFYVENAQEDKDILRVVQVISNTELVVDKPPLFGGSLQSRPVVAGNVDYFNKRRSDLLVLERSSARDSRVFEAADEILGLESDAFAIVGTIDDIELSYIQAMVNRVTDSNTNVKVAVKAIDPLAPADPPYIQEFEFSDNKKFNERGAVIFSKSNDINQEKNLRLIVTLEKDDVQTTTPFVDIETARLFAYIYNVTDDEDTTSRYISKRVELQEGFDAEDFRLYVTGYRPLGTDIRVYIRVKNDGDPVSLINNPWIELEKISGASLFSSAANTNDYKEFIYEVPETDKLGGITTYTNESGTYTGFRSFAIRIDLLSDNVANTPKLLNYRGVAFE